MRLICNDGTRYTKDIDIVRKCACSKKCYWLTDAPNHNSNTTLNQNTAILIKNPFIDNNDTVIPKEDDSIEYDNEIDNDDDDDEETDAIVPAPITQELNVKPTEQPYKLTFYYENDKQQNNQEATDRSYQNNVHHGNYDGLIVQSYDNSADGSKTGR